MVGNILEALFDSVIGPILLFLVIGGIPSYIVILLINRHFRKIEKELEKGIGLRKVKIRDGNVGGNKVIVEYQPPKGLNPTEVGFLYDGSVGKPDIICMVYKWVNMGLVSLEYKGGEIVVKKLLNIKSGLPSYEQVFWNIVFKRGNTVKFPNEKIYGELGMVKDSLLRYCKRMGRIGKSFVYFSFDSIDKNSYIPFGRLIGLFSGGLMVIFGFVTPLFTNSEILLALSLIIPVVGLFVILCFGTSLYETQKKSVLKFTENGKKIVAKIYGYKKFLENCEEEQMKKLMEEDPLYFDKTLPYAIALGLENTISSKIPEGIVLDDKGTGDIFLLEKVL